MSEPIRVRLSKEADKKANELLKSFKDDYKTKSDVIRAGIIHLHKWKTEQK